MSKPGPVLREKDTANIVYEFLPSFRVEGLPKNREVPTIMVEGRDGEIVHPDLIRENPRIINVVGELYAEGATKSERKTAIEEELDNVMLPIGQNEEVWVCRSADDDRFIPAYYTTVEHNYVERLERTIASCRFEFTGFTPHWYALEHTFRSTEIDFNSGPVILEDFTNEGSARTYPVIWLQARQDKVEDDVVDSTSGADIVVDGDITGTIPEQVYTEPYQFKLKFTSGDAESQEFFVEECNYDSESSKTTLTLVDYDSDAGATDEFDIIEYIPVTNPKIYNYANGLEIEYTGTLEGNQILAIDTYRIQAKLIDTGEQTDKSYFLKSTFPTPVITEGTSVLSDMNKKFLVYGFPIQPGLNRFELFDDTEGMVLSIHYRERWL